MACEKSEFDGDRPARVNTGSTFAWWIQPKLWAEGFKRAEKPRLLFFLTGKLKLRFASKLRLTIVNKLATNRALTWIQWNLRLKISRPCQGEKVTVNYGFSWDTNTGLPSRRPGFSGHHPSIHPYPFTSIHYFLYDILQTVKEDSLPSCALMNAVRGKMSSVLALIHLQ